MRRQFKDTISGFVPGLELQHRKNRDCLVTEAGITGRDACRTEQGPVGLKSDASAI